MKQESNILKQRKKEVMKFLDVYLSRKNILCSPILLDVGCGQGSYFEAYAKKNALAIVCIEIDRSVVRLAVQKALSLSLNAEFIIADAHFIPLRRSIVDVTIFSQVLEHLNFPPRAIMETERVSKKGALLLLDIPFLWQFYRIPSGLALRSLTCLKFFGKPNILLKLLYPNISQIGSMKRSGEIKRRTITWVILSVVKKLTPSTPFMKGTEEFIFDYYKGSLRSNIHKNWFYPNEWAYMVKKIGFTSVMISGSFVVPPIIGFSRYLSLPFVLIEGQLPHSIRKWLGQVAIIYAIKK